MGSIYDYYAAADDVRALAAFQDGRIDDLFGTVGIKGTDPYTLLGTVQAFLMGASDEEIKADPRFCTLLSDPQDDGRWLVSLPDALRDALASATSSRLGEAATACTLTEDGAWHDAELIADFLVRLADLARDAGQRALYCGMSL
ncbi:hypothetical protein [Kitasatospora paranensis]|uniref:Uncharacterized protein n=1 Tax=Kitasatospora paranensis TaxID=258053 RepID=A0ABW2G5V4_9ACTN